MAKFGPKAPVFGYDIWDTLCFEFCVILHFFFLVKFKLLPLHLNSCMNPEDGRKENIHMVIYKQAILKIKSC